MLVVTRKVGERIQIGNDITVTVVRINGGTVRVGVDAPERLGVVREELTNRVATEHQPISASSERK